MTKLFYITTNAFSCVWYRNDEAKRYESYLCDGSDDFPILSDEESAKDYLAKIGESHENLSGADFAWDTAEEFDARITKIVDNEYKPEAAHILAEWEDSQ